MLWHKAWLETRWRFLIGLALLMCFACALVLGYPRAVSALSRLSQSDAELARRISESAAIAGGYRGYIWSQWFSQNLRELWALFAVLLGTGGLLAQVSRGGAIFTLSLPVSRGRLLGVRAATALAELLILALVPSLVITLLSPAVGQTYSLADVFVHGVCLFLAGSTLFSLTFLLSTVFGDLWRPPLIVLCFAALMSLVRQIVGGSPAASLLGVMTAERYFRGDGLPWLGLFLTTAASIALLYAATLNIARQDF
jgi:ABC-type transport system involved in multi-copper enzyme maturation permease subunit